MGQYIVKLKDRYLIWSSVVDAPLCTCDTLDDLTTWIRQTSGTEGLRELPARMARVEAKGTSSLGDDSAVDTIWLNRAGPDESTLTIEGIYRHFCLDEPIKDEWIVPRELVMDDEYDTYGAVVAGWEDDA